MFWNDPFLKITSEFEEIDLNNLLKRAAYVVFLMHSSISVLMNTSKMPVDNLPVEQRDTKPAWKLMLVQAGLFSRAQNLSNSTSSVHVIPMTFHQGLLESVIRSNQDWIEMIEVLSEFEVLEGALQHKKACLTSLSLTLAKESSVSVLTPKRGMLELVRLVLCMSFFTPLIWHMGFFFFSFSFCVCGEGISTSCCLSGGERARTSQKLTITLTRRLHWCFCDWWFT